MGEIFKALKGIFYYYLLRGFRITFITGDGEFASIEQYTNLLMGAPRLNLTSANEHEPFIERRIRVVKERVRSIRHLLPFTKLPKIILTHMVFYAVKLLNYFPVGYRKHTVQRLLCPAKHWTLKNFPFLLDRTVKSTRNTSLVTASSAGL